MTDQPLEHGVCILCGGIPRCRRCGVSFLSLGQGLFVFTVVFVLGLVTGRMSRGVDAHVTDDDQGRSGVEHHPQ